MFVGGGVLEGAIAGAFSFPASASWTGEETNGSPTDGVIDILANGTWTWTGDTWGTNASGNWWYPTGTVAGTWHMRLTFSSGDNDYKATGSDALATWIAASTAPKWNFEMAASGLGAGRTHVGTWTLDFSDDAGSSTHHSATITITLIEQAL